MGKCSALLISSSEKTHFLLEHFASVPPSPQVKISLNAFLHSSAPFLFVVWRGYPSPVVLSGCCWHPECSICSARLRGQVSFLILSAPHPVPSLPNLICSLICFLQKSFGSPLHLNLPQVPALWKAWSPGAHVSLPCKS